MWGHQLHGAMKLWGGELRTWGIWGRGTSATPLFQTYLRNFATSSKGPTSVETKQFVPPL